MAGLNLVFFRAKKTLQACRKRAREHREKNYAGKGRQCMGQRFTAGMRGRVLPPEGAAALFSEAGCKAQEGKKGDGSLTE